MDLLYLAPGDPVTGPGWCDEHALPHTWTFPVVGLDEDGCLPLGMYSWCDLDEEEA